MSYSRFTETFADGEHTFEFGWPQAKEWERLRGKSLFHTFRLLIGGAWEAADIREVIRLALLGGGTSPVTAVELVNDYVEKRPVAESLPLVRKILDLALFGEQPEPDPWGGQPARAGDD